MGLQVRHTRPVAGNEPPHRTHEEGETASRIPPQGGGLRDVRDTLPDDIRDPSFPAAIRGYDRRAVDTYVERVNGLIAELQISGSPRAAVRHALDRVGEQTSGILQHARETAEEITTSAREEAEDTTGRAKAEAQDPRRRRRTSRPARKARPAMRSPVPAPRPTSSSRAPRPRRTRSSRARTTSPTTRSPKRASRARRKPGR